MSKPAATIAREKKRNISAKVVAQGSTPKAERKYQAILDAAAELFAERGYAQTTLKDIAEAANTFAGSLYYHFPSKEHLVEEVLNHGMYLAADYVMAKVSELPPGTTFRGRIEAAIRAHLEHVLRRGIYSRAFYKIIDQVPERVRERRLAAPRAYGNYWRGLIEGARAAGELRTDFDPTIVRLLLIGAMTWTQEWYHPDGRRTPSEIADEMVKLFFHGTEQPKRRD